MQDISNCVEEDKWENDLENAIQDISWVGSSSRLV
jgi:hypothetical protein